MENDKIIQDILEIVTYLKDNSVTRDEFFDFKKEVNERFTHVDEQFAHVDEQFRSVREDVISHVDHFIGLHNKLDTELTALRAKYDRLEEKLERVMHHLHLEGSN